MLSINGQLDIMSKELSKVQTSLPACSTEQQKAAHASLAEVVENVKMLNAITAQSEASIASIISNPEHLKYLREHIVDVSVVAVNSNELLSCINKLEYTVRPYRII